LPIEKAMGPLEQKLILSPAKASVAGNPETQQSSEAHHCLARLMEQAVLNIPNVEAQSYKSFRHKMERLVPQLPDLSVSAGDLMLMQEILQEFAHYHKSAEIAVRDQISGWRKLVATLLIELLKKSGIDAGSPVAAELLQGAATLLTGVELQGYSAQLIDFLRLQKIHDSGDRVPPPDAQTTGNHNPAGLRDGALAMEMIQHLLESGGQGFVVVFSLTSIGSIKDRFGSEAMQDCLMAVSAFLTRNLRSDDQIYYWSESSLLAILQTPATKQVIQIAIQRIVDNNRDITIQTEARVVMLRVPLTFELVSIADMNSAEDLLEISALKKKRIQKIEGLKLKEKKPS
jgi:GGDEF domain-containing protein